MTEKIVVGSLSEAQFAEEMRTKRGWTQRCHKKRGNYFTVLCVRGTAAVNARVPIEERLYFCWHAPLNICAPIGDFSKVALKQALNG